MVGITIFFARLVKKKKNQMKNDINSSVKEEKNRKIKKRPPYPSRKHPSVVFNNTAKAALLRGVYKRESG